MPTEMIKLFKSWPEFKQRFLANIPKECFFPENKDVCWEWQGTKYLQGYGKITWGRKDEYYAHRIAYFIFNGIIPNKQVIRHSCDNRSCVNPNHLILGTVSDNARDMIKRNRGPHQKLNTEAVKVIKWMLKYKPQHGLGVKLARLHKVSISTISNIKNGHTWAWVKI